MEKLMKKVATSPRSMKKRFTSSGRCQHKCFGLPLSTVLQQEYESGCASPEDVPLIVQRICDYIVRHGLQYEGIFRINGNSKTIENLRQQFENHEHFDSSVQPQRDIFAMADLLKLFLRELPGGIVSEERTVEFLKASELIPTSEMRRNSSSQDYLRVLTVALDEIRILIASLPVEEYNLLKYLIRFLSIVSEQEDVNKMSPTSLGIVFGPNIFRCGLDLQALRNQGSTNRLIAFFIEHYDDLFNMEAPSYSPYRSEHKTFFSADQPSYVLCTGNNQQTNTSSLYRRASGPVGIEVSYDRRGPASLSAISRKSLMQESEQLFDPVSDISNSSNPSNDDTSAQNRSLPTETIPTSSIKRNDRDSKSTISSISTVKPNASSDRNRRDDGSTSSDNTTTMKIVENSVPVARTRRGNTNNANNINPSRNRGNLSEISIDEEASELASSSYQQDDADNSEVQSTAASEVNPALTQRLPSPRLNKELSHQLCHLIRSVIDEQCFQGLSGPRGDKLPETAWPPLIPTCVKDSDPSGQSTTCGDSSSTVELNKNSKRGDVHLRSHGDGELRMSAENYDESENSSGAYPPKSSTGIDLSRPTRSQGGGMVASSTAPRLSAITPTSEARWNNESILPQSQDSFIPELRPSSHLQRRDRYESSERQSSILSNDEYIQGDQQPIPERRPVSQQSQNPRQYSSSITRVSDLVSVNSPVSQHSQKMHPPALVTEIISNRPTSSTSKSRPTEQEETLVQESVTTNRSAISPGSIMKPGQNTTSASIVSSGRVGVQEAWTNETDSRTTLQSKTATPQSSNTPVEHIFDTLMCRLKEKRRISGRPEHIEQMTAEEVQEEKLEIQKCLLHYENLHGRPRTAHEKATMKPLYDRYRQVKRAIASVEPVQDPQPLPVATPLENSNAGSRASLYQMRHNASRDSYEGVHRISNPRVQRESGANSAQMFSPLTPIPHEEGNYVPVVADRTRTNVGRVSGYSTNERPHGTAVVGATPTKTTSAITTNTTEHSAVDSRNNPPGGARQKQIQTSVVSNVISSRSPEQGGFNPPPSSDSSKNTPSASKNPYENMELKDLLREEAALRNDKVHLQRLLKEFEYKFLENNGRRVEHDDRIPMRAEYNQYKQIKQRLRLLENAILHHGEFHN